MSWAKIDDLLPHHDKLVLAGSDAPAVFGLYVASICYSQRQDTDGRIPRCALALLLPGCPRPPPKLLAKMVALRLWDQEEADWRIHNYLEHNLSADERAAGKRANNVRQQRRRERLTRDGLRDNGVTHADVAGPTPLPSLPVPSQTRPLPSQVLPDGFSATPGGPLPDGPEGMAMILARQPLLRKAKGYDPS